MAIINGYTLVEPPYKGGMALVYKGQKGAFARAFKMVRPDKAINNPRLCQRFLKEIQHQTQLDHPNIIKILDAYPYTNQQGVTVTVLEMEWLNGMDMQRYVEHQAKNGLDASTVISIAKMIIDGLEYAHRKHILHLDIKPSNIFRTNDGYIKIIDFGISRVIGENAEIVEGASRLTVTNETGESTFKGTLGYASPEQLVGGHLNFSSDIYSFGKTLHFMATGSIDPSAEVTDPMLSAVITKCTATAPKNRYQSFNEVKEALSGEVAGAKCSTCGAVVSKNAKFCPNCGTSTVTVEKTVDRFCPRCGKSRNGEDRFCDNCGWDFAGSTNCPVTPVTNPRTITGFRCSRCKQTTRAYADGKVHFCNYCGASKENLTPVYQ